jgi:tryptophanyl-tRNA synthetase
MTFLQIAHKSTQKAYEESFKLWESIRENPKKFTVVSGERPTGHLHLGHLIGSLQNRRELLKLGAKLYCVIADYQAFFDREHQEGLPTYIDSIMLDYCALGLVEGSSVCFRQSAIPQIHELFLCFLSLFSLSELERNPTVKEELASSGQKSLSALFLTYPVHQIADILCVKGNLVPVGQDQLPHIELVRKCAQRFNHRYNSNLFQSPEPLLSLSPKVLGVDGDKMSKSRGNSILLSDDADTIVKKIKKAKTDNQKEITYEPDARPEISQLIFFLSYFTNQPIEKITSFGFRGAGDLKNQVAEAIISHLEPYQKTKERILKENGWGWVREKLEQGEKKVRQESQITLNSVKSLMGLA